MNISRRNLVFSGLGTISGGAFGRMSDNTVRAETANLEENETSFTLYPVGKVKKQHDSIKLQIFNRYHDALKGLDGFSHVFVLYWFDQNDTPEKRNIRQVHPRGNRKNPLTGVFACRAPVRPNLIALSLCKILDMENGTLVIDKIDAFDGSPILDIKPYISSVDDKPKDVRVPDWLKD